MPTILMIRGWRFFFYANEHEPKHIHVAKSGDFAKVELGTLRVTQNWLKPQELRKALRIVKDHADDFERKWDEWFPR